MKKIPLPQVLVERHTIFVVLLAKRCLKKILASINKMTKLACGLIL